MLVWVSLLWYANKSLCMSRFVLVLAFHIDKFGGYYLGFWWFCNVIYCVSLQQWTIWANCMMFKNLHLCGFLFRISLILCIPVIMPYFPIFPICITNCYIVFAHNDSSIISVAWKSHGLFNLLFSIFSQKTLMEIMHNCVVI